MKGFPNQVSDLRKLAKGMAVTAKLIADGKDVGSDSDYGEALVRGGVAGTGHGKKKLSIAKYLKAQKKKSERNQSHLATARGLRELFETLGLLSGNTLTIDGLRIASLPEDATDADLREAWGSVIRNMSHHGNYGGWSHPYQMLLRLVAKRPNISRALTALALEAKNDSDAELKRIVKLAEIGDEEKILKKIGETKSNWDNAKKVLPSFAEQLGDVVRKGKYGGFKLAKGPGLASAPPPAPLPSAPAPTARRPSRPRKVTPDSIAISGTVESFDEAPSDEPKATPTAAELAAIRVKIAERLKRHNLMVQDLALLLALDDAELFENPFDCLARFSAEGLLIEAKTLDGTEADEVIRVRDAYSQLLYYEAFATDDYAKGLPLIKIAAFEGPITADHHKWLRKGDIHPIWKSARGWKASPETVARLKPYFGDSLSVA
jgi:hypothetical protein